MDDNAPIHRAGVCLSALQAAGIHHLEWPTHSPDLNPVENIWALLSRRVNARRLTTQAELRTAIVEEWPNVSDIAHVGPLIASLPRRIRTLRRLRGGPTGYQQVVVFFARPVVVFFSLSTVP